MASLIMHLFQDEVELPDIQLLTTKEAAMELRQRIAQPMQSENLLRWRTKED